MNTNELKAFLALYKKHQNLSKKRSAAVEAMSNAWNRNMPTAPSRNNVNKIAKEIESVEKQASTIRNRIGLFMYRPTKPFHSTTLNQARREQARRNLALNTIRKVWYAPGTGRGYTRHVKRVAPRWKS